MKSNFRKNGRLFSLGFLLFGALLHADLGWAAASSTNPLVAQAPAQTTYALGLDLLIAILFLSFMWLMRSRLSGPALQMNASLIQESIAQPTRSVPPMSLSVSSAPTATADQQSVITPTTLATTRPSSMNSAEKEIVTRSVPSTHASALSQAHPETEEELVALLTAAASFVLKNQVRIVSFQPVEEYEKFVGWIQYARTQQFVVSRAGRC